MSSDTPVQPLPHLDPTDVRQRAYLFYCAGNEDLRAISTDPTARNIAASECAAHWVLEGEILVGVQEALPMALNPEPVLRGLRSACFYVWKAASGPTTTTQ